LIAVAITIAGLIAIAIAVTRLIAIAVTRLIAIAIAGLIAVPVTGLVAITVARRARVVHRFVRRLRVAAVRRHAAAAAALRKESKTQAAKQHRQRLRRGHELTSLIRTHGSVRFNKAGTAKSSSTFFLRAPRIPRRA
jgi:hypothetical protein